jgi:hypothetical protein
MNDEAKSCLEFLKNSGKLVRIGKSVHMWMIGKNVIRALVFHAEIQQHTQRN